MLIYIYVCASVYFKLDTIYFLYISYMGKKFTLDGIKLFSNYMISVISATKVA